MNFDFLQPFSKLQKLYESCSEADTFVLSHPNISATSARKGMEFIVKMIYTSLTGEEGANVFEMVTDPRFVGYVNDQILINSIHFIRKMGNVAVHQGNLTSEDSLKVLEELHFLVGEFSILLGLVTDYPLFQKPSQQSAAPVKVEVPKVQETKAEVVVEPEVLAVFAPRMRSASFNVRHNRDEAENQKLFLAASLRESGWPMVNCSNTAMPCSVGLNMILDDGDTVDYVLYGRDNRPLAVVEYTTTVQNLVEGRIKGIEKADKLAIKCGYKPIVYYTNGYHIYVIDQLGYNPRRVFQFHTIEELELLKLRATMRQDISNPTIDDNITNRDYQKQAIRNACNAFMQNRRHSLLIMATGTGKTRVSISLVDVLLKAGWIKNVLFLADRTSLVRQAHKNFTKLLPSVTTSVYSGGSQDRDSNARIIFSTYQTMIRLINDDTREFGIGRFDLIIIDEAHRSIFKKYGAIFHYFDSLMIGLTATPRVEDNRSTYRIFDLPNGQPDFAYELEEAVKDGFLVGFSVLDRTTDALRRGIYYDELSEEEKEKFEDTFASGDDEGGTEDVVITHIGRKLVRSKQVIVLGTIDVMLNDLMKNGIKVENGDKLGKTIIFAPTHMVAEQIVERFHILYPHLGPDFCKLIDCQVPNNQTLIDNFEERAKFPQVVVSVDMLDTGIDVPDVLNLVFFKQVLSKIKFLQMVGRGTRLSPNIFGPTMNKQGFLIFDYYDNFHYFRAKSIWNTTSDGVQKSINLTPTSILINRCKLNILLALNRNESPSAFEIAYKKQLKDFFVSSIRSLCNDDIEVQYNMAYINKYRTEESWDILTDSKVKEISEVILPLFPSNSDPIRTKVFDLMIYVIEQEVPNRIAAGKDIRKIRHGFGNVGKKVGDMMTELLKLRTIPAILQKEELIRRMDNADLLFDNFSLKLCEKVRMELRDLIQYIPDDRRYYILDVADYAVGDEEAQDTFVREKTYQEKAQDYLAQGSTILAKIRNLDELTEEEKSEIHNIFCEEMGTEAEYIAWSGNRPLLPFLRLQVGIADEAVQTKFGSFLNKDTLNDEQYVYMQQIISYVKENGDIGFLDLQKQSPFCDIDPMALFGTKINYIKTLIDGLHRPVM